MKLEIDAEFASLIPPMDAEEYMQLEANIVADGCRDPLIVWGNILIDGHNRLRICEKHDIQYQVVEREFPNRELALQYIILNQFGRRNLSAGNKSLLALKLEPLVKAKAKANQKKSQGRGQKGSHNCADLFAGIETRKEIAKIAGVSHSTIDRVKHIVDHGSAEQVERIKQGGTGNAVYTVYNELRETERRNIPAEPTAPPPDADMETFTEGVTEREPAIPPDMPGDRHHDDGGELDDGPEPCEDELEQIKRYVAELKNPDLNRSYTTGMFVVEYEAFAGRFIRSLGIFDGAPYSNIYPLLSDSEKEILSDLNAEMGRAIRKLNILIKG